MDDLELLNEIKGNPEAFSELFRRHYKPILGYVLRRTGSFEDAADLTAHAFYKAFKHINTFEYKGVSIKAWLYRISTNEVNLFFRQQQRNRSLFEQMDLEDAEAFSNCFHDDLDKFEQEIHKHKQFLSIQSNLRLLPIKYQEVIALRYFEGKNNKEIAEILDLKEGTVKSILSRGVRKLREKCNEI